VRGDAAAGRAVAYGALVVAAGLNVRAAITSLSAVLQDVVHTYGLTDAEAAVLSSLPVLLLAIGAPLAPVLERRFGAERAVLVLAVVLTASVALRPMGSVALFAGTVTAGAAISGLSVIIPQVVRDEFGARAGLWSGIFSTSFGLSAALGAGLTVPLSHLLHGVGGALAVWAAPAALVVIVGAIVSARSGPTPVGMSARGGLRSTPLLWQITGFFGCQALVFFAVAGWLPTLYADRGLDAAPAAQLLAGASVAGLPASLLVSILVGRLPRQHWLVAAAAVGTGVGLGAVAWGPIAWAPVAVAVLGFSQGAAFGLGISLIVVRAPESVSLARFSAVVQGVGFLIAAAGPLLLGIMRGAGVPWAVAVTPLLVVVVAELVLGWLVGRRPPAIGAPHAEADDELASAAR